MDDKLPTGEEVVEVGVDYLAVKSEAGSETRIPVTSIKAVIRVFARQSDMMDAINSCGSSLMKQADGEVDLR